MSVVTVLAGDPSSNDEVGEWDRLAGFRSAGEAAAARAKEDDRACEVVGARPTRLPFWDRRYARGAGQDEVYRSVVDSTKEAETVLIPGYPLANDDHRWVTDLLLDRGLPTKRLGLYAEQPYAAWTHEPPSAVVGPEGPWVRLETTGPQQLTKLRACRAYRSQVPLLGGTRTLLGILAYERKYGGESVCWLDDAP